MMTAVIGASAALLTLAAAFVVARRRSARSEKRFEAVLEQLDDHMQAISQSLQRVVERSADARERGVDDLELTVDFDEVLRRLAAEAASRAEAQAAAVRVQGPNGEQVSASFGAEDGAELFDAPVGPSARAFRAVTINWTYKPVDDAAPGAYTSALVVPIVEAGVETGTLAAYAREPGVFGAGHIRALETLAQEAAPAIASARRFAEAENAMTDARTGVRNRKGYEAELERAVTDAHTSGLPLSLLLLDLADATSDGEHSESPDHDRALQAVAGILTRVTRSTDVVCRRGEVEFGIVLPETTGDAARRLYLRLREEASSGAFPHTGQVTFAAGLAEWRPNETSDSFDARAAGAVGNSRVETLAFGERRVEARVREPRTSPGTRQSFEDRLAEEIARARDLAQPLALLVMDVDGIQAADEPISPTTADRVRTDVAERVSASLQHGGVSCRVGEDEVAVILPATNVVQAEDVLSVLQASLERRPPENVDRLAVSAGITELATGDDPASVFARAEQALWRAKQAGRGTVVVALAGDHARS